MSAQGQDRRCYDTMREEMGPRVRDAQVAEDRASASREAPFLVALLIAKRIRSFNIREGVKNRDPRDLAAV